MRYFSEFDVRVARASGRAILLLELQDNVAITLPVSGAILGWLIAGSYLGASMKHMIAVVELSRRVRDLGRNAALRIPDPPADHPCAGGCSCLDVRRSA